MKINKKLILFFILISAVTYAQLSYIPINADYATFKGQDGKIFSEFYISFYQKDLMYTLEDSSYVAHYNQNIKISQGDSVLVNYTKKYKNTLAEGSGSQLTQFMDVIPFELNPGNYTAVATILDENSNKSGEYILDVEIPDYTRDLKLSNIELSTKISSGDTEQTKYSLKNNITIFPNPSKSYGVYNPLLYFYFEGYNLGLDNNGLNNYSYKYYISDTKGKRIKEYPETKRQTDNSTIAEANGINIITLDNGNYILTVELEDKNSDKIVLSRKRFSMNKPERTKSKSSIVAELEGYEDYAGYTKAQLIDEFKKVRYISTREEVKIFENLEETEGMKRFLSQFWKRRDFNKETPVNEYKEFYFTNLQFVNAKYSDNFREGWRTDRGRVVLIYGKPDEIERFPSTLGTQPYEIWHYYSLEGGARFVFADLTSNGNYELLHSTYRSEIKDPDWQLRVGKIRNREYDSGFNDF